MQIIAPSPLLATAVLAVTVVPGSMGQMATQMPLAEPPAMAATAALQRQS
jgi:hypothetical protein